MSDSFDRSLLGFLACPLDKKALSYCEKQNCLVNPRLMLSYAITDGIMSLLPESGKELTEAEFKAMELVDH